MLKIRWLLVAMLVVSLLVGTGTAVLGQEKPVKIAVIGPMTGAAAFYGDMVKGGAVMYIEEVNAAGGINAPGKPWDGRSLEPVICDDAGDPKEAVSCAHKFVADSDIVIVVGGYHSSNTFAKQPIYKAGKLPHITPGNTHYEIGWRSEYTFRNIFHDEFHIGQLADFLIIRLGIKSIGIIYDLVDPTTAHMVAVKRHFEGAGLDVVAVHGYPVGTTDFRPMLLDIKAKDADAIFAASYYAEASVIAKQARALGMDQLVTGGEALTIDDYIKLAGEAAAEGSVGAAPFLIDPKVSPPEVLAWAEKFRERWQMEPMWLAANAYDAVGVAVQAISAVGPDRQAIRDYLAGMDTLEEAYVGVTGPNYFDKWGDSVKPNVFCLVKDGKWVLHPKGVGWTPSPLPRPAGVYDGVKFGPIEWPPR
jgi:branched-chain amino acid transport system substrate-binding protein